MVCLRYASTWWRHLFCLSRGWPLSPRTASTRAAPRRNRSPVSRVGSVRAVATCPGRPAPFSVCPTPGRRGWRPTWRRLVSADVFLWPKPPIAVATRGHSARFWPPAKPKTQVDRGTNRSRQVFWRLREAESLQRFIGVPSRVSWLEAREFLRLHDRARIRGDYPRLRSPDRTASRFALAASSTSSTCPASRRAKGPASRQMRRPSSTEPCGPRMRDAAAIAAKQARCTEHKGRARREDPGRDLR
jgi:hypothetical protein